MSQPQSRQTSLRNRNKSPSRIPVPSSTQRKRPAEVLGKEKSPVSLPLATPTPSKLTGFRRLEALAAAAKAGCRTPDQGRQLGGVATKNFNPWVRKHLPRSVDDLFVHKKKVEEVSSWLTRVLQIRTNKVALETIRDL